MSNLQMRIITAICLIAISLIVTFIGGVYYRLFVVALGAAIYHEWQMLTLSRQTRLARLLGWIFYAIIGVALVLAASEPVIFTTILVLSVLLIFLGRGNAAWHVGGFVYALALPVTLSFMRDGEGGLSLVLFLYAVVWAADSAAYFSGRTFGGPKLAPKISPNKTWSGAIGGILASVLAGFALAGWRSDLGFSSVFTLVSAFVLCVVSQIGDIAESWLKRHFNVKDSGVILPGHGGFMDRVDGLIAASSVFYLILSVLRVI